jgi:hypothetical protein
MNRIYKADGSESFLPDPQKVSHLSEDDRRRHHAGIAGARLTLEASAPWTPSEPEVSSLAPDIPPLPTRPATLEQLAPPPTSSTTPERG